MLQPEPACLVIAVGGILVGANAQFDVGSAHSPPADVLDALLERAGQLFPRGTIVSRLPDKSLRRHSYGEYHQRTRRLAEIGAVFNRQVGRFDRAGHHRPRPPTRHRRVVVGAEPQDYTGAADGPRRNGRLMRITYLVDPTLVRHQKQG